MPQLTFEGQQVVNGLASRHGFSPDAVTHMLIGVLNGNGSMAQFSHPEFGGSGQWMRGGMTMVGDMFNSSLKGRVDALCSEIANILAHQPGLVSRGSFQSQNQSSGSGNDFGLQGQSSLFVPDARSAWYPSDFGVPNSTGAQNNTRYAYFANARRLAVDSGGDVWVYDTLNHQIGGFSQQQGGSNTISFTSQFGTVDLTSLPVVRRNGQPVAAGAPAMSTANSPGASGNAASSDVFTAIERLGNLKSQGIVSEEEFAAKKAELLGRL